MHLINIFICCIVGAVTTFFVKFFNARLAVQKLYDAGLPMLEFRFSTGHFRAIRELSKSLPSNTTMHTLMRQASKRFPGGIFYVNLWPFSGTWVVVTSAAAAAQIQSLQLKKPEILRGPLDTITGGPSLITMSGEVWKTWRNLFNPGFSPSYLLQLAPLIVDEVNVFCSLLREQAKVDGIFQLEDLTLRLTVDIIASVALDTRLKCQTQNSLLASALQRQIEWTSFGTALNPFRRFLTVRPLVLWYNSRLMDRFIGAEIDKRYAEYLDSDGGPKKTHNGRTLRSVMSLVLKEYLANTKQSGKKDDLALFKKIVAPQLRLFLFAGRDTTSSTLLYCYYLLGTNPDALARLRAEHDNVFGPNARKAGEMVRESPQKLNQLPYTMAVIREALRLFPPSASLREGSPGVELIDDDGLRCPTAGCYVWSLTVGLHHNQRVWEQADDFRPERWLAAPDDPLYPDKGAWRAFEYGPRNCIGQTLALLELRIALLMTAREFEIKPVYEEWDAGRPDLGVKVVNGVRAYQAEKGGGGAHPADGLPCRILLRH